MDLEVYSRFVLALVAVLALIGAVAWLARRFGLGGKMAPNRGRDRRLAVSEVMALDARRRLVLVKRDTTEHLVLLGPGGDLVLERDVPAAPDKPLASPARPTAAPERSGGA